MYRRNYLEMLLVQLQFSILISASPPSSVAVRFHPCSPSSSIRRRKRRLAASAQWLDLTNRVHR